MATDSSPPRISIIIAMIIVTASTLFTLKFIFESYFLAITEETTHEKMDFSREELTKLRAGEAARLSTGTMPIDKAILSFSAGGRLDTMTNAGTDLTPQPSTDHGALIGWLRAPNQAASAEAQAAEDLAASIAAAAASAAIDAGADAQGHP